MVKNLIDKIKEYYINLYKDKSGRYRSWEHCYTAFSNARKDKNPNYDCLSLQLAFYLASWGMYRGSSFLLRKDYTIHKKAVQIILEERYDCLLGIDCSNFKKQIDLLMELYRRLDEYYLNVYKDLNKNTNTKHISDTLITKILLGTLGCTPAYDQYFKKGIKSQKVATGNFSKKSIEAIIDFYEKNNSVFEDMRKIFNPQNNIIYPQMKIIDMIFWYIGKNNKTN
ncbi:MAG: hypothetical protein Q4B40_03680 [Clostridia bacterium]|nr:hypothetical protein [Clostridia bacterium]